MSMYARGGSTKCTQCNRGGVEKCDFCVHNMWMAPYRTGWRLWLIFTANGAIYIYTYVCVNRIEFGFLADKVKTGGAYIKRGKHETCNLKCKMSSKLEIWDAITRRKTLANSKRLRMTVGLTSNISMATQYPLMHTHTWGNQSWELSVHQKTSWIDMKYALIPNFMNS